VQSMVRRIQVRKEAPTPRRTRPRSSALSPVSYQRASLARPHRSGARLPPAACRLPPAACRLPPAACRLPPAACQGFLSHRENPVSRKHTLCSTWPLQVQQLQCNRYNRHQHSHLHSRLHGHLVHDLWARRDQQMDSAAYCDGCNNEDINSVACRVQHVSLLFAAVASAHAAPSGAAPTSAPRMLMFELAAACRSLLLPCRHQSMQSYRCKRQCD